MTVTVTQKLAFEREGVRGCFVCRHDDDDGSVVASFRYHLIGRNERRTYFLTGAAFSVASRLLLSCAEFACCCVES